MSKLTIRCTGWTPIGKNSLVGKCDIHITELRLSVRGILILESGDLRWVALPSLPMLDRNGVALRDDAGKIRYSNTFVTAHPLRRSDSAMRH